MHLKKALPVLIPVVLSIAALARPANAVTLVYSNDVMAELEPCGCRTNPLGGMSRKAAFLKRHPDTVLLQVDAGNLLFSTTEYPEILKKQAELQAEYLLKALDQLGHDAVTPGLKDFALGVKVFERLKGKSKIKFLAANLKKAKGGKFLEPHSIFTRETPDGKKLRIAVLGLVGENLEWPKELKATSAISAAKSLVPQLRGKADLVIALTHQGLEADEKLAKSVKGIDIIVGAHSQSFLQQPPKVGNTWIYQSSFRNQYIGVVPLTKPFESKDHQLVALDAGFDTPEGQDPTPMDRLVAEFKAAVGELNGKDMQTVLTQSIPDSPVAAKFQTFPRCSECHLKQFDFWRKTAHARALLPLMEKEQFRNKECLGCHTVGLGDPEGFSDVTLLGEEKKGEFNISPIPAEDLAHLLRSLHDAKSLKSEVKLTRSGDQRLPIRESLNRLHRSWAPVQCENCHQPGREHPFSGTYSKAVSQESCLKCHTAERAPEWYKDGKPDLEKIARKRAQITCPAGDLSEEEQN